MKMSNQNRFLLPHAPVSVASLGTSDGTHGPDVSHNNDQENQHSVDTDFDSYWEEEARNPHRNRIRIGRQYQATVPPILKIGESDQRELANLETLTFCPKRSAKVSNTELEHYFTVAKSLNIFASLVETRSLLGRDVTIADLNHIKHKEGLSLASVIQPISQSAPSIHQPSTASISNEGKSAPSSQPSHDQKSLSSTSDPSNFDKKSPSFDATTINQPLMKALSHFISLHHPCHHDQKCKKLNKDLTFEEDSSSAASITFGNLRQIPSSSNSPSKSRYRSALKQEQQAAATSTNREENMAETCEDVELFSKAIEVCGKNFGSIKKEFLPTKSVRSIVEYYYIGSRDSTEGRRKTSQNLDAADGCSNSEKSQNNFNGDGSDGADRPGDLAGPSSNKYTQNLSSTQQGDTNYETGSHNPNKSSAENDSATMSTHQKIAIRSGKSEQTHDITSSKDSGNSKSVPKNMDARMSVYNFEEDFKDESPVEIECPPRPGAEVKPLKAKPIIPNASLDGEASNSNVGSLRFFMDGQLVLKLNACQDQQEGAEKCHWVQSGDRAVSNARQKRYTKRANSDNRAPSEQCQNGSQSNSVVSSNIDEDSKNGDLTFDEDSKESTSSYSTNATPPQRSKKQSSSKRSKAPKPNETSISANHQAPSAIDYNRIAINNRMKDRNDTPLQAPLSNTPLVNPSVSNPASMPNWLQANQFAMAAAILGGLPFPVAAAANMMQTMTSNSSSGSHNLDQPSSNNVALNMATSRPMDLSIEHTPPKPISTKSSSRTKSKQRN